MRHLLVVVVTMTVLGVAAPVSSAPPATGSRSPELPATVSPVDRTRPSPVLPFRPLPERSEGCVLPVSSPLQPCGLPGGPEQPRSCVVPVVDLQLHECADLRWAPGDGGIVPLQSATDE